MPPGLVAVAGSAGGLDGVQLLGLLGRHSPELGQIDRNDNAVTNPETTRASDRVPQRLRPVMLEQNERSGRIIRDLLKHIPRLLIGEDLYALDRRFGARLGTLLGPLLTLDPKTDKRADLASELDRLILAQIAEMRHLNLAVRVRVNRERVNHADGVFVVQPLKPGDDLPMKIRVLETQND